MELPVTPSVRSRIVVKNLSVDFSGRTVLNNVSFSSVPGEITVIMGPSGSGKSTLLRAINRLNEIHPQCRTRGSIRLELDGQERDVYGDVYSLPDLRRRVGMLFQTPSVLPFSIEKNLTLPLRVVAGLKSSELRERMECALKEAALWDEVRARLQDPASTLSGGQQQRLCLARVLALGPEILLLDEPTASLDFKAAAGVENLLLELKTRYCILAVSHSLSQAQRLADRILVLREGEVVQVLRKRDMEDPGVLRRLLEVVF